LRPMLSLQRQLVDEFQSMRSQPTSKQQSQARALA